MKIFRGPVSRDFPDDSYELVDTHDFSKEKNAWVKNKNILLNISKEANERQSAAQLILEEDDILALHQGLILGLREQAMQCEKNKNKISILVKALNEISVTATLANLKNKDPALDKIKEKVAAALQKIKK